MQSKSAVLKKNDINWPQQPPTENVLKFKKIFHDSIPKTFFQNNKIMQNSNAWMTLKASIVIFKGLKTLQPQ